MDDFQKLQQKATFAVFIIVVGLASLIGLVSILIVENFNLTANQTVILVVALVVAFGYIGSGVAAKFILSPLHALWRAILHVVPESSTVPPPNMENLKIGRALVTTLANRVYQFASQENSIDLADHRKAVLQAVNVVSHFPLPIFVFNKELKITNASNSALEYLKLESPQLFGQVFTESVNLEFPSEHTLEAWIKDCQQNKITDHAYWQRVHVNLRDGETVKQCDIAAYYNRNNESGTEFIVTLFDHTELYDQDDQSLSFVALAVHEFRTPLTMLRGYIEVFEEELSGKLEPKLEEYLRNLEVSAHQLAAFVDNILNVVKIEQNQLTFQLIESDWPTTVKKSAAAMELHAKAHGKRISFHIDQGLPAVAIDPVSISLVVNNLLDNAIKYSRESHDINVIIHLSKEGMVETTVQDFGTGIPEGVLPNLFEKFYRNHRTRNQIGGTGLGLYLCKAIVDAHGGHIWVKSKVGAGSSFTFTLQPYASLSEEKKSGNPDITRHAHGWIKNHSLYRR